MYSINTSLYFAKKMVSFIFIPCTQIQTIRTMGWVLHISVMALTLKFFCTSIIIIILFLNELNSEKCFRMFFRIKLREFLDSRVPEYVTNASLPTSNRHSQISLKGSFCVGVPISWNQYFCMYWPFAFYAQRRRERTEVYDEDDECGDAWLHRPYIVWNRVKQNVWYTVCIVGWSCWREMTAIQMPAATGIICVSGNK